MKFEQAIAAMREGKRCRCSKYPDLTYRVEGGTLLLTDSFSTIDSGYREIIDADWSIVEPPPPLPRLFRAKLGGKPVSGAFFQGHNGLLRYAVNNRADYRIWYREDELTDLEYIEVP